MLPERSEFERKLDEILDEDREVLERLGSDEPFFYGPDRECPPDADYPLMIEEGDR